MNLDCPFKTQAVVRDEELQKAVDVMRAEHWLFPYDDVAVNPCTGQVFVFRCGEAAGETDLETLSRFGGNA
jgi:hypothetical protein